MRLLLWTLLLLLLAAPVAGQSWGDFQDLTEPLKQVLLVIIDIFSLDFLGNDETRYIALARALMFLITFVVVQQLLARIGHLSPRSCQVIAFCIAAMSILFIPADILLVLGESYAAFVMTAHLLVLTFVSIMLSRKLSAEGHGRFMFVFIHVVLIALWFFIVSRMWGGTGNYQVGTFNTRTLVWLITGGSGIFLWVNLARGLGWEGSMEIREPPRDKEVKALKLADKARGLLKDAGSAAETLRQFGQRSLQSLSGMKQAAEVNLAEIGTIIRELMTALSAARAAGGHGVEVYREEVEKAQGHAKRLHAILGAQKRAAGQQAAMRNTELRLASAEKSIASKASKALQEDRKTVQEILSNPKSRMPSWQYSLLARHLDSNEQLKKELTGLEKAAETLLRDHQAAADRYKRVLQDEGKILTAIQQALRQMERDVREGVKLLKNPTLENIERAVPMFQRILAEQQRLESEVLVEFRAEQESQRLTVLMEQLDSQSATIAQKLEQGVAWADEHAAGLTEGSPGILLGGRLH